MKNIERPARRRSVERNLDSRQMRRESSNIPLPLFERRHFFRFRIALKRQALPPFRRTHFHAVNGSAVTDGAFVGRCCWSRDRRWGLKPSTSLSCSSIT